MPKLQPMPGGHGGHGRGRRRAIGTSLAEINVVPLVDVMLVLLIIFMVTAPLLQRGVDVRLPTAVRSTPIQGERVFVNVPLTYKQDGLVFLADEPLRLEVLQERVRQRMENQTEKRVYLRVDGTLTVQDQMDVIDRLKAAGVSDVGLVTRIPGE
jgi:biopolymer transport protein ExbD